VTKRIAPVGLILAVACGGGGDGIGPTPVSSDLGTMAVGDVRVYNPSDLQNGLDLPTQSSARDYVIIVGNTSAQHDVVANYVVRADKSTPGSLSISTGTEPASQSTLLLGQPEFARTPQGRIEKNLRAFERSGLALRSSSDPLGLSRFSVRRSAQVSAAAVPVVGDVLNIKIPDTSDPPKNLCTNFISTQGVVASVSQRAILVVDTLDGPPLLLFPQAVLDSITQEFDNITYPTGASYFGTPTDVDANARVILLFTGQVNKLTPPSTPAGTGFVVGFFFAGDFFPATGTTPGTFCPQSNVAEIFYLLAPDPAGAKYGNVRSASSVRQSTRGTVAHEFQHMINAGRRFQNPLVRDFESTWLDEGLAHFSEDAVGRVQRGFTDLQTLTFNEIRPCSPCAEANDYNAFFFQNLARLSRWMERPDTSSGISARADQNLSSRGAAWAIVRYVADNFSNGDVRALTRELAAGPDTGVRNFTVSTGASIDTLVAGWLVSMYADHLGIPNLNAKYQYRSYNFRSVMPPVAQPSGTYPLQVQAIGSGSDNISATNRSGSGTYYRLNVAANAGPKNVRILNPSGGVASFSGEHVYVLRVQ